MYNNDEQLIKEQKQKLKNKRDQELSDIKILLDTPAGIRFFKRFLEDGHIFHTSMTGSSYTFFNEGERNLVLKYFRDICESAPEKIADLILTEKKEN